MASFDWKKNIEDCIKDGLIITATATGIFYALKVASVKPPKASMDALLEKSELPLFGKIY